MFASSFAPLNFLRGFKLTSCVYDLYKCHVFTFTLYKVKGITDFRRKRHLEHGCMVTLAAEKYLINQVIAVPYIHQHPHLVWGKSEYN